MTLLDTPASVLIPAAAPAPTTEAAPLSPAASDPWTFSHDWDALGQPLTVTHAPSGLSVTYPATSRRVARTMAGADILAQAVDILAHPNTSARRRTAALTAVADLEGITAYCWCGGLLHWAKGQLWRHVNACGYCLDDPAACGHQDRARHTMCAQPEPVQCEHHCKAPSDYLASQGCGADKRCCGNHDCDTAA